MGQPVASCGDGLQAPGGQRSGSVPAVLLPDCNSAQLTEQFMTMDWPWILGQAGCRRIDSTIQIPQLRHLNHPPQALGQFPF